MYTTDRDRKKGRFVTAGEVKSVTAHEVINSTEKRKLLLSLFVDTVEVSDPIPDADRNDVHLFGFICKPAIYRKTPKGREICDALLAVNRPHWRSDYIPCIFWGRSARYISEQPVGTGVSLDGRIQSREYQKKFEDGTYEVRTAYEVSVSRFYSGTEEAVAEMVHVDPEAVSGSAIEGDPTALLTGEAVEADSSKALETDGGEADGSGPLESSGSKVEEWCS